MKIKKTITIDTKGIQLGDVFYKFPIYNDANPNSFYKGIKLTISDISISKDNTDIKIHWNTPVINGTLPEENDGIDFKNNNNKNEKNEEDIRSLQMFTGEEPNRASINRSFNFYVLDKKGQVQKEIKKRKQHVLEKMNKLVLDSNQAIVDAQIIIDTLKNN